MNNDKQIIKETVRTFIAKNFLKGAKPVELQDATALISGGIIDSISTMSLVAFLEKEFSLEFEAHEVDRSNLDSIDHIADFVLRKKK